MSAQLNAEHSPPRSAPAAQPSSATLHGWKRGVWSARWQGMADTGCDASRTEG